MKAKIRKTGEIVDVICYEGIPNRRNFAFDYVNYIDSLGNEHIKSNHLNYYWDFEPIDTSINEHLKDVRERAEFERGYKQAIEDTCVFLYLEPVSFIDDYRKTMEQNLKEKSLCQQLKTNRHGRVN